MGILEFCSLKYSYFYFCLLDAIIELHALDETLFNDFLNEK